MKRFLILALSALSIISCTRTAHVSHPDWAPDVRKGINAFMDEFAHSGEHNYVVFDFDNTTSIFDIEENQMLYQLERMCFEMDPDYLKEVISTGLDAAAGEAAAMVETTAADYRRLWEQYGPFTFLGISEEAQERLHADPVWEDFAARMMSLYSMIYRATTPSIAYNWTKYWVCGMTDEQVDDLSQRSHSYCSSIPTVSGCYHGDGISYDWEMGVGVTDNLRELWKTLHDNGIDVWVCSASGTRQVLKAVDLFGLRDYCTGVLAMTISHDGEGRFTNSYDYVTGYGFRPAEDGSWKEDTLATRSQTCGPGKVTSIMNAIAPHYGGRGPIACFMDSTGDFNFCTEFASTRMVVCFNRGDRKITDGGGLIALTAIYERDDLGYDLRKAGENGDILYLLQGRDDNGMRSLRPSNAALRLGHSEEKLFANEDNHALLGHIREGRLSVREILETYSIKTAADESAIGVRYGFLDSYDGYRSK